MFKCERGNAPPFCRRDEKKRVLRTDLGGVGGGDDCRRRLRRQTLWFPLTMGEFLFGKAPVQSASPDATTRPIGSRSGKVTSA